MYSPPSFQVSEEDELLGFVERYPFATLVSRLEGELFATHLPLMLDRERRCLLGHVARANPHWHAFREGTEPALAIFHGPHAYVSPTWYQRRPAVPTWNYAVVHARGPVRLLAPQETRATVSALVRRFEEGRDPAWSDEDLAEEYRAALLDAVVGLELTVARLEGKYKLGQNRSAADRAGTLAHLETGNAEERALAEWTRRALGLHADAGVAEGAVE